jgi:thioredoxin-related protein
MDNLTKVSGEIDKDQIMKFVYAQIPEFDSQPEDYRNQIIQRVKDHFKSKEYTAETFEKFSLQGTPSIILIDRKGILRDVSFGQTGHLDSMIQKLIAEG